MRGSRSFRFSHSEGLEGCSCTTLCWVPLLMMLLSFLMGVSCLFFMSVGGLVLGIIYCTAGCALAFVPFALYKTRERFWGIVSIISIVSLMLLLISSFGYGIWLVLQNSRAQNEKSNVDGSPVVVPLLGMYAQKAGFGSIRRLQASPEPVVFDIAPLFGGGVVGSERLTAKQALPAWTGAEDEASTTTTNTSARSSYLSGYGEDVEGKQNSSGEQAQEHEESGSTKAQAEALPLVRISESTSGDGKTAPAPGKRMEALVRVAKRKADKILVGGESSFYPTVLRQSWETRENIFVSKEDLECLEKMNHESGVLPRVESLLRTLLDWGLFCGYTRYTIAVLRKWPVSCSSDCNFDKLNFSRYRNNKDKTEEQAKDFLEAIDSMTSAQAEACTFLATVAGCRINERNLDSVATTSICIALIVSVAIFCACIKCLADCIKFIKNDNKRMERVAASLPTRPG